MAFNPDEFRKKFLDACDQADGVRAPVVVRAEPRIQAGAEILFARCPVSGCGEPAALSGEGKHWCRRCGSWLRYVRDERKQKVGRKGR